MNYNVTQEDYQYLAETANLANYYATLNYNRASQIFRRTSQEFRASRAMSIKCRDCITRMEHSEVKKFGNKANNDVIHNKWHPSIKVTPTKDNTSLVEINVEITK